MRASTIFALIVAVLIGLGAAVAVKASGWLMPAEAKREAPMPQILVTATNVFEGNYVEPSDVKLRPARNPDEAQLTKEGELLPPVTQAAIKRIARMNIPADTPIRKDMLEDVSAPPDVSARLLPGTRAVNVVVAKEHSAGCLIKPGDVVDVEFITSAVGADGTGSRGCTAIIARDALVVAKRNSLYPMPGSPRGPCPCNYTLAVNPYRAGLIEFAKDKGVIALHPQSNSDHKDRQLQGRVRDDGMVTASWTVPGSTDYADEDRRVAEYVRGGYVIGEKDLERVCRLGQAPTLSPSPPPVVTKVNDSTPPKRLDDYVAMQFTFVKPASALASGRNSANAGRQPGSPNTVTGPGSGRAVPAQSPSASNPGRSSNNLLASAAGSAGYGATNVNNSFSFRFPEAACAQGSSSARNYGPPAAPVATRRH